MITSLIQTNRSIIKSERSLGTIAGASVAAALAMGLALGGCVVEEGDGGGDIEQTDDTSIVDTGDTGDGADPAQDEAATDDKTAPTTLAGKTLETAKVKCPYWANGTYYDDYDNNPNDWVVGTGYRAYANECALKSGQYGATVRLVTSCSYGFTYYSAWKTFYSGWVSLESPSQAEAGCVFGVANYWLEQQ